MNHALNLIGQGKAIKPTFLSILEAMTSAAFSVSQKKGIGQVFLSVIRERTNPGQIVLTLILYCNKSPLKASPHAFTHALEAL